MPQRGRKRKSRRQNAGPRVLHDTLLPVVSMQIVQVTQQERLRRGPACEEGKKEGACRCPKKEGNECGQEFYTTPAACCVHANPEPSLSEVVRSEQDEPAHVSAFAGSSTTACAASSVVSTACSVHANPAPMACGVHPSIAGAGCIRRSRARVATVDRGPGLLHGGRGLQLSRALPCGHAATRACCSNASAGKLRKPLVQDLHGLNSTALDSCNP